MIKLGGIFDLEAKDAHLNNLKDQISDPSLWDNNKKTTSIMKEISMCEKDIVLRKSLSEKASDIKVIFEFFNDGQIEEKEFSEEIDFCLLYTSPSPRDGLLSRMPSSA